MALQWTILTAVCGLEMAVLLLLCLPMPRVLQTRLVSMISRALQPLAAIIPFSLFQTIDLYLKFEHRLQCQSESCTLLERVRSERITFKSQRNFLLALGACLFYWLIYSLCKVYREMYKLEMEEQRLKAD